MEPRQLRGTLSDAVLELVSGASLSPRELGIRGLAIAFTRTSEKRQIAILSGRDPVDT
jgi:hypothetical protein